MRASFHKVSESLYFPEFRTKETQINCVRILSMSWDKVHYISNQKFFLQTKHPQNIAFHLRNKFTLWMTNIFYPALAKLPHSFSFFPFVLSSLICFQILVSLLSLFSLLMLTYIQTRCQKQKLDVSSCWIYSWYRSLYNLKEPSAFCVCPQSNAGRKWGQILCNESISACYTLTTNKVWARTKTVQRDVRGKTCHF